MDAVRFLSFLQSFAATASARVAAQPASGDSLQSTLSDFEAQLRSLMQQPGGQAQTASPPAPVTVPAASVQAASVPAAQVLSRPADTVFVTGGSSGAMGATPAAATGTAAHTAASAASAGHAANAAAAATGPTSTASRPGEPAADEIRKIIAWQKDQLHPMLHVRMGDIWARQGITDPQNDPALIAQAQQIFKRGENVRQINTAALLPWQQPWQAATTLVAASGSDPSGFVTGGRG